MGGEGAELDEVALTGAKAGFGEAGDAGGPGLEDGKQEGCGRIRLFFAHAEYGSATAERRSRAKRAGTRAHRLFKG